MAPKVGTRHFSYGPKGRAAAQAYAKKTGQPVKNKKAGRKK